MQGFYFTFITGLSFKTLSEENSNIKILSPLPDIFSYLKVSDLIIAPGGHSTMMEALSYGVPMIIFPDMNHGEQENNARRIEELKLGRYLSYHTPPEMVKDVVENLLGDMEVKRQCKRMANYAEKLNGVSKVVEIVEDISKR